LISVVFSPGMRTSAASLALRSSARGGDGLLRARDLGSRNTSPSSPSSPSFYRLARSICSQTGYLFCSRHGCDNNLTRLVCDGRAFTSKPAQPPHPPAETAAGCLDRSVRLTPQPPQTPGFNRPSSSAANALAAEILRSTTWCRAPGCGWRKPQRSLRFDVSFSTGEIPDSTSPHICVRFARSLRARARAGARWHGHSVSRRGSKAPP
jgi:hypothetical protein